MPNVRLWLKRLGIFALIVLMADAGYAESVYKTQKPTDYERREDRVSRFSLNTQLSTFTGDYGGEEDTTVSYITETLKYTHSRVGELSVSVPYVFREGNGVTAGETVAVTTIPEDADGIGDVLVKGRYYLVPETQTMPGIDLTGRVKFPTADENEGLGTGRYDAGGGVGLTKRFGKVLALADTEVIWRDRRPNSSLKRTRWDYAAGLGYPFTPKLSGYVFYEGSTKPSPNSEAPSELVYAVVYKVKESFSVNGYVLQGLSDGSPDVGGSVGATWYF